MRLGIIGLPQSGKTTIFNALTQGDQPIISGGGRFETHTAVVDVPDARLEVLSEMYRPKKTTCAKVTYTDIAGLGAGAGGSGAAGISGQLLNQLAQMEAFLLVIRAFDDETVPHPAGRIDPQRDLEAMLSEFTVIDLLSVESKLERLEEERRKGGGRELNVIENETALFQRLKTALETEGTLRGIPLSRAEAKTLAGFGFLSLKPLLVVLNTGENGAAPAVDIPEGIRLVSLMGKLEMELTQLEPDEARMFMDEFGIEEAGLERVIRASYTLLDVITFFTVSDEEVRARTLPRGATAIQAAGSVHSDLEKGFIRAEVIGFDELVKQGGMAEARASGRLRLEGKEYEVRDGEIVQIRFNL